MRISLDVEEEGQIEAIEVLAEAIQFQPSPTKTSIESGEAFNKVEHGEICAKFNSETGSGSATDTDSVDMFIPCYNPGGPT